MTEPIRKLAAIVFTDIVGFTKLTAEDQSKASALLKQQRELFRPIVDSYKGRWVKEMGDGLILTFDTVTDAVNCCIKLQETSNQIDNLDLRIGIHEGEILIEENDIIGDDVNIAARIEPFAAPGGIAISNKVHDAIVRESEFTTKYLGKPKLKGVGQEVKVYCITSHDLPETDLSKVSAKLEPEGFDWNVKNTIGIAASVIGLFLLINFMFLRIGFADEEETPSIAILPFENKGAEADDFYAYGISSDLISDVTSAGLIRVASLKDIEKLEYQDLETSELAKKLFVRYVAQGTLWKMDSIFQLSMEIFDTELSKVIYTKRWQTNWKDLATIKDDLSDNILEILKIEVLRDVEDQIVESNPEAYEYYLRGKYIYKNRQDIKDIQIARDLLKRAVALDKNLIIAQHLIGITHFDVGDFDKAMEIHQENLKKAEEQEDNDLTSFSLNSIGRIYFKRGDYVKALDYYERSVEIKESIGNRNTLETGYTNIGAIYLRQANYDKASYYYEHALAINKELGNKNGLAINYTNMGYLYHDINHLQAIDYFNQSKKLAEEVNNKSIISASLNGLGNIYNEIIGDYEKSLIAYRQSLEIDEQLGNKGGIAGSLINICSIYLKTGHYNKALEYYQGSNDTFKEIGHRYGVAFSYCNGAIAYYGKGEYAQAVDLLEKSLSMQKEIGVKEIMLETTSYLFLSYDKLGKDYDINEIKLLVIDEKKLQRETNKFAINFNLFQLLDDISYLNSAYNQVQEQADAMKNKLKYKFLNYPIPKQIIQEWERVS